MIIRPRSHAMHGAIVILMALGGLGCHNKDCQAFPTPQVWHQPGVQACTTLPSSWGHPSWPASQGTYIDSTDHSMGGGSWRGTLWSFIIGHDPDVPTVRDIEARLQAGPPY
jgi:hypothetical protein